MNTASALSASPRSRVGAARRVAGALLSGVAVLAGAFAGAAAFLVAAGFTARPALLILAGALALFSVAQGLGTLAARVAGLRRPLPFGLGLAAAALALAAGLSAATVFRPAASVPRRAACGQFSAILASQSQRPAPKNARLSRSVSLPDKRAMGSCVPSGCSDMKCSKVVR